MKNGKTLFLIQAALIAGLYVALTVLFAPIGFGEVQVRIAEMLTILPYFTPAAIPGVFIGCLLGNTLGGAILPDILLGSLTTLLAACLTYLFRKRSLFFAPLFPILANGIIVPFILKYFYAVPLPVPLMMLTVGVGEVLSCGVLGIALGKVLEKHPGLFAAHGANATPGAEKGKS